MLKKYQNDLAAKDIILKESTVLSLISKAKAKGLSATTFLRDIQAKSYGPRSTKEPSASSSVINDIDLVVGEIYEAYEKTLRQNNSLDFDDLLVFGVKLFTENHDAVRWCEHVLVDELYAKVYAPRNIFADQNPVKILTQPNMIWCEQLLFPAVSLLLEILISPVRLSILNILNLFSFVLVYGWRSAEVENLARMQKGTFSYRVCARMNQQLIRLRFLSHWTDTARGKLSLNRIYSQGQFGDCRSG